MFVLLYLRTLNVVVEVLRRSNVCMRDSQLREQHVDGKCYMFRHQRVELRRGWRQSPARHHLQFFKVASSLSVRPSIFAASRLFSRSMSANLACDVRILAIDFLGFDVEITNMEVHSAKSSESRRRVCTHL